MSKYILKQDRQINGVTYGRAGDTVHRCLGHDYGCAAEDTRSLGIEHISVTHKQDGDYPFFTVPVADLEPCQ